MKRQIAYVLMIVMVSLTYIVAIYAGCPPGWVIYERIIRTHTEGTPFERTTWRITWQDGNTDDKTNEATGEYYPGNILYSAVECMPRLEEPRSFPKSIRRRPHEEWAETAYDRSYDGNGGCENVPNGLRTVVVTHPCGVLQVEECAAWLLPQIRNNLPT